MNVLICILCGIIVLQELLHRFERRDLYNRIMSKTFTEYKNLGQNYVQSAHKKVLKRWRETNNTKE